MTETIDTQTEPTLTVVVPVKNEETNIVPLLDEIRAALSGRCAYEVIYVDDGSDDGTPAALQQAALNDPALRVIRHAQCCGQSSAVVTGARFAKSPWIATLDGDGQNDPADLCKLLDARDAAPDPDAVQLVAGQRVKRQDSQLKLLSSRIANGVRSKLLSDGARDTGCGIKLFRKDSFLQLPPFDHMHRFLPALFHRNRGVVLFVDVSHRPRTRGKSKYGLHNRLWVGIVDIVGVMWLNRRPVRPDPHEEKRP